MSNKASNAIDGVILLDKSVGMTSQQAVYRVKRMLNVKKAGHTGTLDPFATGLLPICLGEATKYSQDLLEADKTYEACIRLGIQTQTGDTEGQVIKTQETKAFTQTEIDAVLKRFMGPIKQVPPMYAAIKRDGKPLYEYARQGVILDREPRDVVISQLDCLKYEHPNLIIRVRASKGTYIRVLGEDIGKALGCGAHLTYLRRTFVGHLSLDNALTLEQLEEQSNPPILPVDYLVSSFDLVELNDVCAKRFLNGQRLSLEKENIVLSDKGRYRVYGLQAFLGTAVSNGYVLSPERVLNKNQSVSLKS